MGCGQSKIDKIYPRKRKRRGCGKTSEEAEVDEEAEEADLTTTGTHATDDVEEEARKRAAAKLRLSSTGPLSAHTETSSSQLDFFKMLDEKIEKGPDYDATSERELSIERARLSSLIRDWESASSSTVSRSLPSTPGPRRPLSYQPLSLQKQYYRPQYQVNGDIYTQQQQYYHTQFAQQQYQNNIRGQFFLPQQPQMYQYPRVYSQMDPKSFQSVPGPPQATSVVQYRKSRGVYTELA